MPDHVQMLIYSAKVCRIASDRVHQRLRVRFTSPVSTASESAILWDNLYSSSMETLVELSETHKEPKIFIAVARRCTRLVRGNAGHANAGIDDVSAAATPTPEARNAGDPAMPPAGETQRRPAAPPAPTTAQQ